MLHLLALVIGLIVISLIAVISVLAYIIIVRFMKNYGNIDSDEIIEVRPMR